MEEIRNGRNERKIKMGNEGRKGVGDGEGDRAKEKSNDSSRRRLMLESCSLSVCLSLPPRIIPSLSEIWKC